MVSQERLEADCRSLQAFANLNPDYISITQQSPDLRHYRVRVDVDAPVAKDGGYEIIKPHDIVVDVPDNYLARDHNGAFVKSRIRRDGRPIFHPNSWESDGALCYDSQFAPGKSLGDQVLSAILLMQCVLINPDSPASWDFDWAFRQHGDEIRSRIRQVALRLPRYDMRIAARVLPRLVR